MSVLDSSVHVLLSYQKKKRKEKKRGGETWKKGVSEELSQQKKRIPWGVARSTFSQAAFHILISVCGLTHAVPEWEGPGSQDLCWPRSIDKLRDVSAKSSWGSPSCQVLWKLLPIQPRFSAWMVTAKLRGGQQWQQVIRGRLFTFKMHLTLEPTLNDMSSAFKCIFLFFLVFFFLHFFGVSLTRRWVLTGELDAHVICIFNDRQRVQYTSRWGASLIATQQPALKHP